MKINILGKILEINLRKNEDSRFHKKIFDKFYKNTLNKRIIFFLLVVGIFFSTKIYRETKQIYHIGAVASNDIIAHKDVSYIKDILDEELKNKIIQNTNPEYDRIEDIQKNQMDRLEQFLQNLNQINLEDDNEIKEIIKLNKINLSISDVRKIGISKSVKYYLHLSNILDEIYIAGVFKKSDLTRILAEKQIILNDEEKKLINNFIEPNLKLNKIKTEAKIEKNLELLKNNVVNIKKGDIIIREGEIVNATIYDNLYNLGYINKADTITRALGKILIYTISSILFFNVMKVYFYKSVKSNGFYPMLITVILINLSYSLLFYRFNTKYLAPLLLLSIITSILTKDFIFTFIVVAFNYIFVLNDIKWAIITIILSTLSIYINKSVVSRNELVKNSVYIGLIQSFFAVAYGFENNLELFQLIPSIVLSMLSGLLTGIFSIGLLPYFENTFKILTDIKLLELSNFSNTLLKNLLITAPGTFHHSIMVGALAEAGAESVGANAILCRVASYYHDIGKMKRPSYFVENQHGIVNPHNNLSHSLSSMIITSHTKDGYLLGKQYGLPIEILDIILEHHGTTLVQYFYYKALENGEKVLEEDFRYQGPKPQTKESGIIMLADTIEAAVRANSDKSSENIEKVVRYLIKSKLEDNQLVECDLTLAEIEKVTKAFLNILKGIYHERIQYKKGE